MKKKFGKNFAHNIVSQNELIELYHLLVIFLKTVPS
jgi:hypothetical protein